MRQYSMVRTDEKKGELVECRLCLEDTICHASLFHELYYWLLNNWLFSLARSVLTIHSVARKSKDIVCYSRLLNLSLQSRLWVHKRSPLKLLLRLVNASKKWLKTLTHTRQCRTIILLIRNDIVVTVVSNNGTLVVSYTS